jgi:hypothetical protein
MAKQITPATVYVTPHIVNINPNGDDSDPEEDRCFGHSITGYEQGRKHYLHYGPSGECRAWLTEHGYEQVARTGMREIGLNCQFQQLPASFSGDLTKNLL